MTITSTKKITVTQEIELPYFCKEKSIMGSYTEYFAIYSEDENVPRCRLDLWHDGKGVFLRTYRTYSDDDFLLSAKQITAEEFEAAKREAIARLRVEGEESLSVTDDPQVKYAILSDEKPSPALLKIENSLQ